MTMRYKCGHQEQETRECEICALRAENKTLKKERKQIIESEIDCGARSVAKDDEIEGLRQELRRYTSWQPSDTGTKEAMKTCRPQESQMSKCSLCGKSHRYLYMCWRKL
jgi:hypothetical protein